jgi:hypothetical protein
LLLSEARRDDSLATTRMQSAMIISATLLLLAGLTVALFPARSGLKLCPSPFTTRSLLRRAARVRGESERLLEAAFAKSVHL